ncbi:hypothetical protein [Streptacidiphilus sp. P02-A3a]|uniref:hypothetical protein n=1 Tax=Streptacidiphilus sp. P02-A3a TaxID=2704468 RepID=UPI0015F96C81|nr:hypothetical protein [Streptacidiphilus sp. P02-A3a]QMU69612.1 hypothetical protein GXP74_16565 [Streptacidiphilus sp. P02-A3a]
MPRKGFIRVGVLALGACAMVLAAPGLANASVSPTPVVADSACQALELTKIVDGHDHMFVDPTVDTGNCYYMIIDMNTGDTVFLTVSSAGDQPQAGVNYGGVVYNSPGVYDGPGVSLAVEVTDSGVPGADRFGPKN